jgi:hypothetical protein
LLRKNEGDLLFVKCSEYFGYWKIQYFLIFSKGLNMPRVVVTGLGLVIANGIGVTNAWDSLINGKDGTAELK